MSDALFKELVTPNGMHYTQPLGLFLNNEWFASSGTDRITATNPSDESEICTVHGASPEDVDRAVQVARTAFDTTWREIDATGRGDLLSKLADLTEQHADTLASIETWDNGPRKTYNAARTEDLPETIGVLRYYAGWADKMTGQSFSKKLQKLAYTIREPLGVVAAIIRWNYPLSMAAYKLAPASSAGNTVVLKVAEQTPLSALYLANLVREAGFPPGVVNIVNGFGRQAGAALAEHPGVDKISFTGSTPKEKQIMKLAARTLKNVTLETGGKSPMIILDDADLAEAVQWAHSGIMSNHGQVCSATSRLLVQEGIYDDFIEEYKEKVQNVRLGDPFNSDTFQGPQITRSQYEKVLSYVEKGKQEGATLALGGTIHKNLNGSQEVFGPFVVVSKFKTVDEAIRKANNSMFGLRGAVFTRDITKAHVIARRLESGTVWINSSNDIDLCVPFGGFKQSEIGHELGEMGLLSYTTCKTVYVNLACKL